MSSGSHAYHDAIIAELDAWPGATVEFSMSSKHRVAVLHFGGKTRKTFYPCTPGDVRGVLNKIGDIRHELIGMGAVRTKVAKSPRAERRKATTSQPVAVRPVAVAGLVVREDRWSGPLAALRANMSGALAGAAESCQESHRAVTEGQNESSTSA